jgi:hypothetical protein
MLYWLISYLGEAWEVSIGGGSPYQNTSLFWSIQSSKKPGNSWWDDCPSPAICLYIYLNSLFAVIVHLEWSSFHSKCSSPVQGCFKYLNGKRAFPASTSGKNTLIIIDISGSLMRKLIMKLVGMKFNCRKRLQEIKTTTYLVDTRQEVYKQRTSVF